MADAILPGREGRCADQFQGPLKTGSQGLPSRHTIGTSFPDTEHTAKEKKLKKINYIHKSDKGKGRVVTSV